MNMGIYYDYNNRIYNIIIFLNVNSAIVNYAGNYPCHQCQRQLYVRGHSYPVGLERILSLICAGYCVVRKLERIECSTDGLVINCAQ